MSGEEIWFGAFGKQFISISNFNLPFRFQAVPELFGIRFFYLLLMSSSQDITIYVVMWFPAPKIMNWLSIFDLNAEGTCSHNTIFLY